MSELIERARELRRIGDVDGAFRELRSLVESDARDLPAVVELAEVCEAMRQFEASAWYFAQAELLSPREPAYPWNAGRMLVRNGTPEDGISYLLRARTLGASGHELLVEIAVAYVQMGLPATAVPYLSDALGAAADAEARAQVYSHLGHVHAQLGDFDRSVRYLRRALADGGEAPYHLSRIALFPSSSDDADLLREIEAELERPGLRGDEARDLHQGAAAVCSRLGRSSEAFAHSQASKAALTVPFDRSAVRRRLDVTRELFSEDFIAERQSDLTISPVFIVGMPRSGSTLLESSLDRHPALHGIGERNHVTALAHSLYFEQDPDLFRSAALALTPATTRQLGQRYLAWARLLAPKPTRPVDKLLLNFRHVGLILTLFPEARILHTRRNALDTCLSIYTNPLEHSHPYAADIDDLAWMYAAYTEMMRHWERVAADRLLSVDYEEHVQDPTGTLTRVTAFLGLEQDERSLKTNGRRTIQTMSGWQARQPIYRHAMGRSAQLGPELQPLADALTSYGIGVT